MPAVARPRHYVDGDLTCPASETARVRARNGSRPTCTLAATSLGGPIVNLKGEIVGINAGFMPRRDLSAGADYIFPASRVRRIAVDLAEFGQVRRGYLGIQVEPRPSCGPAGRQDRRAW